MVPVFPIGFSSSAAAMTEKLSRISRLLDLHRDAAETIAFNDDETRSWGDFKREVGALLPHIASGRGGSWLVACGDAYELAVAVFAVLQAGGKAVLPALLESGHLTEIAGGLEGVVAGEGIDVAAGRVVRLPAQPAGGTAVEFRPLDPEASEIILYTSGSTAGPLPIRKPLRCLEAEVAVLEKVFAPPDKAVVLATVPAHHIYGLLFRVLWPLASGRVFDGSIIRYPADLSRALKPGSDQILVSSPAFLKRALPAVDLEQLSSGLSRTFSSGGPLSPDVAAKYNDTLKEPVREVYGSTETGGIAYRSVLNADKPEPWTTFPGVELSLDDDTGVLLVRSPNLPDDNHFRTGDRVRLLSQNSFVLEGRADRVVKVEQQRVSLTDLERRLSVLPEIIEARVLSWRLDGDKRDALAAVIVPSPDGWVKIRQQGKRQMVDYIRTALKPQVGALALPRRWRFLRHIPEDDHGKTRANTLKALWNPESARPISPQILDRTAENDNLTLALRPPENLLYFDGHFNQEPILPGVVQIDWAIDFASRHFSIEGAFHKIEALKFHRIIRAGQEIDLTLRYNPDRGRVDFRYSSRDNNLSSGRIYFETDVCHTDPVS